MSEGAFIKAFREEMAAAAHQALVETYEWVAGQHYGCDPTLKQRAEEWAARIEAEGKTMDVLVALSEPDDPARTETT